MPRRPAYLNGVAHPVPTYLHARGRPALKHPIDDETPSVFPIDGQRALTTFCIDVHHCFYVGFPAAFYAFHDVSSPLCVKKADGMDGVLGFGIECGGPGFDKLCSPYDALVAVAAA